MTDVRDVAQHQLAIDRAASAGLWTPDMPSGVTPEMVYLVRRMAEEQLTARVGPLRGIIEKAIQDVGMPPLEPWIYLGFNHTNKDGDGFVSGMAVAPGHIIGRQGLVPFPFHSPYPWEEGYRDYSFEYFGRRIMSEEDAGLLPTGALFRLNVEEVADLDGPQVLGIEVWRSRVFKIGAPVYGRGDWRPGMNGRPAWPKVDYGHGGELPARPAHMREADQGLRLLRGLPLTGTPGRRHGSGEFPDEETFRAKVEPVIRTLRAKRGKATRDDAAEELHINSDHLKDVTHKLTQLDWPEFVKTVA